MHFKHFVFLFLIFTAACSKQEKILFPAFYHWKTKLHLSNYEKNILDSLQVKKLYVKFFDLDWDEASADVIPHASLITKGDLPQNLEIVPCIFITNRSFKQLPEKKMETLAIRVMEKIDRLARQIPGRMIGELQFDCDWTTSTRDKYFRFLEIISKKIKDRHIILSGTIRLHQVKYPKRTGVPPVDRGMLMFYNMGDLENPEETNSILNLEKAEHYVGALNDYPLELDVALPIFSWAVAYRGQEMIKLITEITPETLADSTRFVKEGENRYHLLKSTYINGIYLYKGDWLRTEGVTPEALKKAALLLQKNRKKSFANLTYYHLDSVAINRFSYEDFSQVQKIISSH